MGKAQFYNKTMVITACYHCIYTYINHTLLLVVDHFECYPKTEITIAKIFFVSQELRTVPVY